MLREEGDHTPLLEVCAQNLNADLRYTRNTIFYMYANNFK